MNARVLIRNLTGVRVVDLSEDARGFSFVEDRDVHFGEDSKHCVVWSAHDQFDVLVFDQVFALADLKFNLFFRLH